MPELFYLQYFLFDCSYAKLTQALVLTYTENCTQCYYFHTHVSKDVCPYNLSLAFNLSRLLNIFNKTLFFFRKYWLNVKKSGYFLVEFSQRMLSLFVWQRDSCGVWHKNYHKETFSSYIQYFSMTVLFPLFNDSFFTFITSWMLVSLPKTCH